MYSVTQRQTLYFQTIIEGITF